MTLFKLRRFRRRSTTRPSKSQRSLASELSGLLDGVSDPKAKRAFQVEMQTFNTLFSRYLLERAHPYTLDWERIQPPTSQQLVIYEQLTQAISPQLLSKLAVLKFNGGLGTSMGLSGAKCALEVSNGMTFLDLIVRQVEYLNTTHHVNVPLILMTSFNTLGDTIPILKKYDNTNVRIKTFNQSRYPRILKDTLLPSAGSFGDDNKHWYPPGHGDLYPALLHSGVLRQLIDEGKEYLFVSNVDNLGATVDLKILELMQHTDFIMEVTDKTKLDIEGGALVDYEGALRLLELAQVPPERTEDFKSKKTFINLNTNNLWINLKALNHILGSRDMELDIMVNVNTVDEDISVLQLETAAGAAIKHFKHTAIRVPRDRFFPVKNCSDFFLIKSGIYYAEHGCLKINGNRTFNTMPVVKLGDSFKNISEFRKRFKDIPDIIDLDHLTVTGDVFFGRNVKLSGTVIIVANEGQRIDIPDNSVLENRLLCGDLKLIEL